MEQSFLKKELIIFLDIVSLFIYFEIENNTDCLNKQIKLAFPPRLWILHQYFWLRWKNVMHQNNTKVYLLSNQYQYPSLKKISDNGIFNLYFINKLVGFQISTFDQIETKIETKKSRVDGEVVWSKNHCKLCCGSLIGPNNAVLD